MYKKIFILLFLFIVTAPILANAQTKPYTIMIYMNGSDLESDFGLATDDLAEIIDSGLRAENANVLILTGGTKSWQNDAIPASECIIWQFADGWINEKKSMGLVNMGSPETLRDFLRFSIQNYPADKYGLIMWDHGGGAVAGFGHDEKFGDDSLSLLEMKQAFEEAGLRTQKLEFLGFDACLMATVEMAVIAADYAHVMIASEDLEPGDGWDYTFLSVLNENPGMCGFCLGQVIVDSFMDFFGLDSDEILTLSVVDLASVRPVMQTMGALMARATAEKFADRANFYKLAKRRSVTKTFGEGTPRDNYADMVDIGDMVVWLSDLFPVEAAAVLDALENCVVYNRHNSDVELWGLSSYYVYGGMSIGDESLATYSTLSMDRDYTQYLHKFLQNLRQRNEGNLPVVHTELAMILPAEGEKFHMIGLLQTEVLDDYLWPKINGYPVVLFPINSTKNSRIYATPAQINGRDVDIIIAFSARHPQGRILGSREVERVYQKGYDPILAGDTITLCYQVFCHNMQAQSWISGEAFAAPVQMSLTWETTPNNAILALRLTDCCGYVTLREI